MKKIVFILIVSFMGNMLMAQDNKDREPYLSKSLTGQAIKEIEAETSGGNISVESVTDDKARVEVFARSSNWKNGTLSKDEIQKKLDEFYELKIDIGNNKVTAIARSKSKTWNRKNSLSISFKVFVPASVSANLTTSGGNINLTGLSGQQKISTSGGNLVIDRVKGKLKGTTSGGNIVVKDSDDDINLTTSGGNIEATNCKGTIRLVTSGGSIELADLQGNTEAITSGGNVEGNAVSGDLEAYTSGGNIALEGLSGNLATGTSGGNVRVVIKEAGKFIKIKNSGGNIDLQLPANKGYDLELAGSKIKTDHLGNFSGKIEDDEISGKLNGGGSKITVEGRDGKASLTLK